MIKRLRYIFLPVLAVLLMSHNVNAIAPVINLNNYTLVRSVGSFNQTCTWTNGDNYTNGGNCSARINGRTRLNSISSDSQYAFKTNDLLVVYLFVWADANDNILPLDYEPRLNTFGEISNGFDVLGYNVIDYNSYYSSQIGSNGQMNLPNYDFDINFNNSGYFYRIYELTLRARSDANLSIGLTSNAGLFEFNTHDSGLTVKFSLRNAKQYRFEGEEVNKEQAQATQDAADNSSTVGGTSSSDAASATSSLLSVIGAGIGAITTASPTNCKINGNMGNLNIGNIDLCANPVPSFIAVIGSIIAVLVVLPLVIVLFNRFISIFRSFQG